MQYSDYILAVTDLLNMTAAVTDATAPPASNLTPTNDQAFNDLVPRSIEYVELRMQRMLDLINTRVIDETGVMTPNSRTFTLPTDTGIYVVVEQVYPIVAGAQQAPLIPVSLEFLNFAYPSGIPPSTPSVPKYWAPVDGVSIRVGPPPDAPYGAGVIGTQRLTPLSASAVSNFLTTSFSDAYLAGSMKWWFENYQRDGGEAGQQEQMASKWETDFNALMSPALIEEGRKKFQSVGWSGRLPAPAAAPPQT